MDPCVARRADANSVILESGGAYGIPVYMITLHTLYMPPLPHRRESCRIVIGRIAANIAAGMPQSPRPSESPNPMAYRPGSCDGMGTDAQRHPYDPPTPTRFLRVRASYTRFARGTPAATRRISRAPYGAALEPAPPGVGFGVGLAGSRANPRGVAVNAARIGDAIVFALDLRSIVDLAERTAPTVPPEQWCPLDADDVAALTGVLTLRGVPKGGNPTR